MNIGRCVITQILMAGWPSRCGVIVAVVSLATRILLADMPGAKAEYARVPFADVGPYKVPDGLTDEQVLFLTDIFPTGYMAAENCNIQPGDTVAVWGCGPVICARGESKLEWAQRELRSQGADVLAIPCDVSDPSQVESLVNQALHAFARIDILINNAGIIQVGPLPMLTMQDFEQAMDIMFWGTLYPTLAVLPQMQRQGQGRIVNITSIGGKVAVPHLLPYACAKFAAVALSEGLRSELHGSGIQATTIVPGLMRTGSHPNALFKGQQEKEFSWFAMGAGMPFISIDVEQAAQQIITAMQRGDAEAILSLPAQVLARVHGLFPGLTADLAGIIANVLLPGTQGGTVRAQPGREVERTLTPIRANILRTLTIMGHQAAERYQP